MAPYKSSKQAAYMHAHLPKIAKKWDKEASKKIHRTSAKAAAKRLGY